MSTRFKWLLLAAAIMAVLFFAGYMGLYNYILQAWKSEDFRLGVLAEIHGVIIETAMVVGLLTWLAGRRENKRWKPARLVVARHVCRVHQMIFNSLRWVVDPEHHMDLKQHGFPPSMTQREADAWGKEHQISYLDFHYNELKKMIEYNNVALNSSLHPKIITYIEAAKEALATCHFVVDAYKDKNNSQFHGSFSYQGTKDMENIYKDMLALFPEISELEKPIGPPPISAKEILDLVKLSNKKCAHLNLRIIE